MSSRKFHLELLGGIFVFCSFVEKLKRKYDEKQDYGIVRHPLPGGIGRHGMVQRLAAGVGGQ